MENEKRMDWKQLHQNWLGNVCTLSKVTNGTWKSEDITALTYYREYS